MNLLQKLSIRSGTLVISGNVKVTPAAVSHGTLSVRVRIKILMVVMPLQLGRLANAAAAAAPDTEIEVQRM